jgi:hypothetical protein
LRNLLAGIGEGEDAWEEDPAEAIENWDRAIELSPPGEQPRAPRGFAVARRAAMVAEVVAEFAELAEAPT